MRFIFPIILILVAGATFIIFTRPLYTDVRALKTAVASYDEALTNSRKLQSERDAVNEKYRQLPPEQIARLEKLLPDTADSIHLVIDLQRIAKTYGLAVTSVKFDADQSTQQTAQAAATGGASATAAKAPVAVSPNDVITSNRDYGTFGLSFSTTASYEDFLKFIGDIESSLRLIDIESVDFSVGTQGTGSQTYNFNIKLNTYWLKSS